MPYLSLTFMDDYGRTTVRRVEIEEQNALLDYSTLATDVTGKYNAITDLALVRTDLVLNMGDTAAVVAGANVDVGATFQGLLSGGENKKASLKIPGIKAAFVGPDGTIDITQAEIAAYLDEFLTVGGDCLLSDGEQIESWLSGRLDK